MGRRIVLVLDNGGCFTSRASTAAHEAAKPDVRIFWRPRYTSETLNWIENFWEKLKSTYFIRMLMADRDSFMARQSTCCAASAAAANCLPEPLFSE
jgi:transposase